MTELNKRSPELQPVTVPAFVVNEYNQLKLENIALKEQLRWRPVSELPEKDQIVIATYLNSYGKRRRVRAVYIRQYEEEAVKMNVVHLCDCMEFMKGIPDKYYELCITDLRMGLVQTKRSHIMGGEIGV